MAKRNYTKVSLGLCSCGREDIIYAGMGPKPKRCETCAKENRSELGKRGPPKPLTSSQIEEILDANPDIKNDPDKLEEFRETFGYGSDKEHNQNKARNRKRAEETAELAEEVGRARKIASLLRLVSTDVENETAFEHAAKLARVDLSELSEAQIEDLRAEVYSDELADLRDGDQAQIGLSLAVAAQFQAERYLSAGAEVPITMIPNGLRAIAQTVELFGGWKRNYAQMNVVFRRKLSREEIVHKFVEEFGLKVSRLKEFLKTNGIEEEDLKNER